jgi:hypothetical protein
MARSATKYYCYDCRVMFTIYWTPTTRKKPFCPLCTDGINVRRTPYSMTPADRVGTRPKLTETDILTIIDLYNNTNVTAKEIGAKLQPPRTEKSIRNKLSRLRKEGKIL